MQFNVVNSDELRRAQDCPDDYRDLIVRVAGYSDYFVDLTPQLQNEIIERRVLRQIVSVRFHPDEIIHFYSYYYLWTEARNLKLETRRAIYHF